MTSSTQKPHAYKPAAFSFAWEKLCTGYIQLNRLFFKLEVLVI